MSDPDQYTVGWICALETEYVAARALLEKQHSRPETLSPNDNNHYTLGEIGGHQVVIAVLPDGDYGTSSAAGVARDMLHSFPNIRFGLMVGIGGGVPTKRDIRLGDIVVSSSRKGQGGLLQYDLGKELQGQDFHQTGFLNQPPSILRTAIAGLQAKYELEGHQLKESIQAVLEGNKRLKRKYAQPPLETDRLFESYFAHPNSEASCGEFCDSSKLIRRPTRTDEEDNPAVHYGLIASGNRVIKDATFRDKLAAEQDVLCFEMEAAGLMNHFPCLVIRGVCDYADSHKSKEWQGWAAMTAAAYARDLLYQIIPQRVKAEPKASEVLDGIKSQLANVSKDIYKLRSITSGSAQEINALAQSIDLKELPIAAGAEFGTYMDQHEEECLLGTRKELLLDIQNWAISAEGKCIFWLNGLAGTGKSTISRTMAMALQKQGLLGASFFFKRGEGDRGNATRFFSTIVQQLFTRIPELRAVILRVIRDNPRISAKPLKEQFDELIHKPLHSLTQSKHQSSRLVVVVDALDECDNDNDIQVILRLLPRVLEVNSLCLRFFITSRPELPIRLGFRTIGHRDLILHEVPKPIIKRDISMFLEDRLVSIRHKRSLSSDWPGSVNFQTLVTMSVPLFIFAATICRLLEDHNLDPEQCLTEVLKYQNQESKLDGTYLPVLDRLISKYSRARQSHLVREVQEVVSIIILLESPLSVTSLSKLMGISTISINARLSSLHSVLNIPNDETAPVRLFHLSFRDFLLDSSTREETPFWVDEKETNQILFIRCLSVMRKNLKKNMCHLKSYGTERSDIDPKSIVHCLPPELQYSCRYWIRHFAQSEDSTGQTDNILAFLEHHLLHWVEAMCILGNMPEVVEGITTLQSAVQDQPDSEVSRFLHDAKRYILRNAQIIDIAPLQLYASGLIFAPKMAITKRNFESDLPDWLFGVPSVKENWSPEFQTLEGHSNSVFSVIFSPDTRLLASGSGDQTIKLWDPRTGALKHTLEGHSDQVWSVAFSLDGCLLASGSVDRTIKIWNSATDRIWSVSFSPDGQLLASGSSDNTIKLWDPANGTQLQSLKGHFESVLSVVFSPDSRLLASSSADQSIKLWNPATGAVHHTLGGNSGLILSITFSPDCRLLASASGRLLTSYPIDQTIKLWDPTTGALLYTLDGHSDRIQSVAFSPDGQLLVSGSSDQTIKLWDLTTGALQHTLVGHSALVMSVSFSSDGQMLASGSTDQTIKLWDLAATTATNKQTIESHSGLVQSLAFSPDKLLLASGSIDRTIKLWDPATGALKQTLKGHLDSRLLASSSSDQTIKLWNPTTGSLKHTISLEEVVDSVEFSNELPHLITSLGNIDMRRWYEISSRTLPEVKIEVSLQAGRWIVLHGQRELWLPPDYRPSSSVIRDGTVALGCRNGEICVISFSESKRICSEISP
ncbi:putative wd40 protein [Aspergillus stella-maris]|uniref:putative wd40 protein n=1 Tax=Aspergillus stella-maris TaxID=1810926 RepID=UPI003CCE294D